MTPSKKLIELSPQDFILFLKQKGIRKFYFIYDKNKNIVLSSHPELTPIAEFIMNDRRDFNEHEGLFFQVSKKFETLQGAFVHRTNRGQAAGGVRYWSYNTMEEYLRDGLRLAKGMTHKNSLAGLWWGGGKGVMSHNPAVDKYDEKIRESLYKEYGELMTSINGCYVTAEDVGTNVNDMANIFSKTRFTTCIPGYLGGSGNPSVPTARGVVSGMEAALKFLDGSTLQNKIVAVQGMGNVGSPLIKFLFEKGVKQIIASDINPDLVGKVSNEFNGKNLLSSACPKGDYSILETECDILAPCATGAILNQSTIPKIRASIVCGAANNQLEDHDRDDDLLFRRKIIYVPDFLTNRMGIVNCANEQYGYVNRDPFIERHLEKEWEYSVYRMTLKVLGESKENGEPPSKIAIKIADKLSRENHPVFGHRGQQIIDSLVENKWHLTDN